MEVANSYSETAGSFLNGRPNLSTTERAVYIAVGLGLAAAAAKPRPNMLLNILALAGGSYLAWRGYEGSCPVKAALFGPDQDVVQISRS
jgi:threonine/homoserine/homoserine lactone efflux protein